MATLIVTMTPDSEDLNVSGLIATYERWTSEGTLEVHLEFESEDQKDLTASQELALDCHPGVVSYRIDVD